MCSQFGPGRTWAGIIYLHEDALECVSSSYESGIQCELVAISLGEAYNGISELNLAEWEMEERPESTPKYEFYNVLWIEWKGRIAYRKGMGRVIKSIWDCQATECINLILG
jgi:hypothetical protein